MVSGQSLWEWLTAAHAAYKVYKAVTISDSDMAEYMEQTMVSMDKNNNVYAPNSSYSIRLNRVTKGLNNANGIPLNFKVYNAPTTVNAFASPDGSIRVYSGLMDIVDDDELRGIIAHEIGHIAKRHSLKQLRTQLLASAARDGLTLSDSWVADLAASQMGDLSEVLINAHYSRVQETEADEFGYRFLKAGGYSPVAMISALSKLKDMQDGISTKYARYVITLFSSHPYIDDRIDHLCEIAHSEGLECGK